MFAVRIHDIFFARVYLRRQSKEEPEPELESGLLDLLG